MSDIQVRSINEDVALKRPGFLRRLLWVFTSPGKLAAALAEKPRILFWYVVSALAMDILYLSRWELYLGFLRESALASMDYMESFGIEMTPEMVEAQLPKSAVTGLISVPLTMLAMIPLITLVFFAILKLFGGQGKFKAYMSVVVHANIITVLYTLLLIPISFVTGSLMQGAPLTSLATLVTRETANPILYGALASIDIFNIWYYVVMAIGFTAVSKLKKKYVYAVTIAIFLISVIINIISLQTARSFM